MRTLFFFLLFSSGVYAQDSLVNSSVRVVVNTTGKVSYYFASGVKLENTSAAIEELNTGYVTTASFSKHQSSVSGKQLTVTHSGGVPFSLVQHITLNESSVLIDLTAVGTGLESRNITPLQAAVFVPGNDLRILDVPFDND